MTIMIKFRQILQESHQRLEESQKFYPLRELEDKFGICEVDIQGDKKFKDQYQKTAYRSTIKKLIRDGIYMKMVRQVEKLIIFRNFLGSGNFLHSRRQ